MKTREIVFIAGVSFAALGAMATVALKTVFAELNAETDVETVVEQKPLTIVDAGTPEISEEERKIQAIINNFTVEQINQMLWDIPVSDKRPESERNRKLLYAAEKRLRPKSLSKPDAVNEKLRNL